MPQPLFIDPETGLQRSREQRPEGEGTRYVMRPFGKWEIYHCLACPYDSQFSDQFDIHYFQTHVLPAAERATLEAAAKQAEERARRVKPDR